jgi:iron complex outermembrane recepter protein
MKNSMRKCILGLSFFGLVNGICSSSYAAELEEIIVIAQKRSESLQDVPIAMTALSSEALQKSGVRNFKELANATPGLAFNTSSSFLLPFLRGVGANNAGAGSHNSVAVYFDDVYSARAYGSVMQLDNIEQVEVLKGPQATLYGRNATGGAILIKTKTPMPGQNFEGKVSGTLGDYDHKRASVYLAGSLSEQFAASIAGTKAERNGFVENITQVSPIQRGSSEDLGNVDSEFVQGKLTFQPNDDMTFTLGAFRRKEYGTEGSNWSQVNPGGALLTLQLNAAGLEPAFGFPAGTLTNTVANATFATGEQEGSDPTAGSKIDEVGFDLHGNIAIGESMELVSITGYRDSDYEAQVDLFFAVELPTLGFTGDFYNKVITQELRLQSTDERIDWLVGVDYIKDDDSDKPTELQLVVWPTISPDFLGLGNGVLPLGGSTWDTEGRSVFGDATIPFGESYSLTVGARYTEEEFEVTDLLTNLNRTKKDKNTTWRIVLDKKLDLGMVYGSLSRGFVSGGFNVQSATAPFVEPEQLTSLEFGLKADLSESVRFNASVFAYEYEDIHSSVVGGASGGTTFTINGDKAEIRGLDLESTWAATENLTINAGLVYLFDREYTDFEVAADPVTNIPGVSASGNDVSGAPELTYVLNADYLVPLESGNLTINGNISYNSGYFIGVDNTIGSGGLGDDSFTVVNARISYMTDREDWEISAWMNNILDEFYYTGGNVNSEIGVPSLQFPVTGSAVVVNADPRHFGVTVSYNF